MALHSMYIGVGFLLFSLGLLSSASVKAEDSAWTAASIDVEVWDDFFTLYQRFLNENPFHAITAKAGSAEAEQQFRDHCRKKAVIYAKFAAGFTRFSKEEEFQNIVSQPKKEKKSKMAGTWELYKNRVPNAQELWFEACYLRFQALLCQSEYQPETTSQLHLFVGQLKNHFGTAPTDPVRQLYLSLKRRACFRSLQLAAKPLKKEQDRLMELEGPSDSQETDCPLTDYGQVMTHLDQACSLFRDFLEEFPDEPNLKFAERFLDVMETWNRLAPPEWDRAPLFQLNAAFDRLFARLEQREGEFHSGESQSVIVERLGLCRGILRRHNLLGAEMPIWGVDAEGRLFDDQSLQGKVVLLDFWATWCGPCVAEFPHLKQLYEKYHDQGFEIVGYSVDSDREKLYDYLQKTPLPWPILSKEASIRSDMPVLSTYYGASKVPVVLLRDRQGKAILLEARGAKLDETLERLFEKSLE